MDKFKSIEEIEDNIIKIEDIEVLRKYLLRVVDAIKISKNDNGRLSDGYDFGDDGGVLGYDVLIAIGGLENG